jgi:glutathione S-transferase
MAQDSPDTSPPFNSVTGENVTSESAAVNPADVNPANVNPANVNGPAVNPVTASTLPRIVGRSSSHFTRVVRLFAEECAVRYDFQVVPSLLSEDAAVYGGNPGLRVPTLVTARGPLFGSLGSCRALASLANRPPRMVWPESTALGVAANALELSLQAMSTEVTLIMTSATASPYATKLRTALEGMLGWLEASVLDALEALPERDLSYLELSLFCLLDHLEFREVMVLDRHDQLRRFRDRFAERPSAAATRFRFDS